ncbi:DNA damage-binding protein 1a [Physocladia obscura]|uniref:DNA damage-binding protein 1 n=1 Tax=Physocladia obscura TaxID=109957 RepID=A0AAD5XIC1_9FUNG|nr:DNA damage-binding protein 1a [Physocladia obscura]
MLYLASAHKASSSLESVAINSHANGTANIAVKHMQTKINSKGTHIQIIGMAATGFGSDLIAQTYDIPINGRIRGIAAIGDATDNRLLFVTAKAAWAIIDVSMALLPNSDSNVNTIVKTIAHGSLALRTAAPSTSFDTPLCTIFNTQTLTTTAVSHIFQGFLSVIVIAATSAKPPLTLSIRIKELDILHFAFLQTPLQHPIIAILHETVNGLRFIVTYQLHAAIAELTTPNASIKFGWSEPIEVSASTQRISSLPDGGLLAFDANRIALFSKTGTLVFETEADALFTGVSAFIPSTVKDVLVSDFFGGLYALNIENGKLDKIGNTSQAATLTFLDPSTLYLGSHSGDSYIIQFPSLDPRAQPFTIVETFLNIAPIIDFTFIEPTVAAAAGQGRVIACCGTERDGSLRVLTNGVGVTELFEMPDIEGIRGIWAGHGANGWDELLVLSFVGETKILLFDERGTCAEVDDDYDWDFAVSEETLIFGNVAFDQFLQVTAKRMMLFGRDDKKLRHEWISSNESRIVLCTFNSSQIIAAVGGNLIVYFEVEDREIIVKGQIETENQVSCLDIPQRGVLSKDSSRADYFAAGMWTDSIIKIFSISTLSQIKSEQVSSNYQLLRSVKFARLAETSYLLVGLGDGQLVTFTIGSSIDGSVVLANRKKLTIGTQPLNLELFKTAGKNYVFSASDMPAVLYASNNNEKLLCSNLNLKGVSTICQFRLPSNPDTLAIATSESLKIGSLENIQKLHVQTIPLGETPRRIIHRSDNTLGVLTSLINFEGGKDEETNFLRVFDDTTFDCLDFFKFKEMEVVQSICSLNLPASASEMVDGPSLQQLLIIGTGLVPFGMSEEPTQGRVCAFEFDRNTKKLELVTAFETKGCVFAVSQLKDGLIVIAVRSKIQVLKLSFDQESNTYDFASVCAGAGFNQALYLSVQENFITVGDLMKSATVFEFIDGNETTSAKLVECAKDYLPAWTTCVHAVKESSLIVVGEAGNNLYTLKRQSEDMMLEDEKRRLELVGVFHLGESVNVIKNGSLAMSNGQEQQSPMRSSSMLFCTVDGQFGTIINLEAEKFKILSSLQSNLERHLIPVGNLDYAEWRAFTSDKRKQEAVGYIDGDFVQQFAALSELEMSVVFDGVKNGGVKVDAESIESVLSLLEEMAL